MFHPFKMACHGPCKRVQVTPLFESHVLRGGAGESWWGTGESLRYSVLTRIRLQYKYRAPFTRIRLRYSSGTVHEYGRTPISLHPAPWGSASTATRDVGLLGMVGMVGTNMFRHMRT
jgi:hypothetical protein